MEISRLIKSVPAERPIVLESGSLLLNPLPQPPVGDAGAAGSVVNAELLTLSSF